MRRYQIKKIMNVALGLGLCLSCAMPMAEASGGEGQAELQRAEGQAELQRAMLLMKKFREQSSDNKPVVVRIYRDQVVVKEVGKGLGQKNAHSFSQPDEVQAVLELAAEVAGDSKTSQGFVFDDQTYRDISFNKSEGVADQRSPKEVRSAAKADSARPLQSLKAETSK